MRFPNEHDLLQEYGAVLWRTNREAVTPDNFDDLHPSEKHIPTLQVDRDFHNNGTLEEFVVKAERAARELLS